MLKKVLSKSYPAKAKNTLSAVQMFFVDAVLPTFTFFAPLSFLIYKFYRLRRKFFNINAF
jgi:hypothetical protein